MDEKEILIAMKRIKKIEDEARKRLIQKSLDVDKINSSTSKMGGKITKSNSTKSNSTKSNSTKSNYEKPVLKLYCIFIKPNGVQCSKYQVEGCNKMCKQHHDNSLKSKDPKDIKESKVSKKIFVSKDLEDPLPPIPSNKKETKKVSDSEKPKKKESIPAAIKTLVWNKWVGEKEAESGCYACRVTTISMRHFIAGHIVSEKHGGKCTIDNLRPICQPCNLSMGTMNMNEYIEKFGLHK